MLQYLCDMPARRSEKCVISSKLVANNFYNKRKKFSKDRFNIFFFILFLSLSAVKTISFCKTSEMLARAR